MQRGDKVHVQATIADVNETGIYLTVNEGNFSFGIPIDQISCINQVPVAEGEQEVTKSQTTVPPGNPTQTPEVKA